MRLRNSLPVGGIVAASLFWLGGLTTTTQAHNLDLDFTQFHLSKWDADNGLPSSSVNAIAQTKDGYIWFATYSGLARFDGVRFTVFDRTNDTLPQNEILSLLATPDGALWIGTARGATLTGGSRLLAPIRGCRKARLSTSPRMAGGSGPRFEITGYFF
jgi:ligand-binding sensor domain-containing protein